MIVMNVMELTVEMVGAAIMTTTTSVVQFVTMELNGALVMRIIVLIAPSKISKTWLPTKRS